MAFNAIGKWKSVRLQGNLLTQGELDGLIGIEKLSDYTVVKEGKHKVFVTKSRKVKTKPKKRKKHSLVSDSTHSVLQSNKATSAVLETKVQKRKSKEHSNEEPERKKWKKEKLSRKDQQRLKPEAKHKTSKPDKRKLKAEKQLADKVNYKKKKVNSKKKPFPSDESKLKVSETESGAKSSSKEISPQLDMSAWYRLFVPEPVITAFADLNFTTPTAIQALTLPGAIAGHRDIVGAAETGSGKTLAFGIPIIHGILKDQEWEKMKEGELEAENENVVPEAEESESETQNDEEMTLSEESSDEESDVDCGGTEENELEGKDSEFGCVKVIDNVEFDFEDVPKKKEYPKNKLRALILTPTRELAIQVKNHISAAAKYTDIKVVVVVGGMAQQKQERLLSRCPEVVVGTPGRLWELIQAGIPHLSNVEDIRYLVIDETDRMVEKGHFQELQDLLELLNRNKIKKNKRQTFVFSATLTLVHPTPRRFTAKKAVEMTPKVKLESLGEMIGVKPNPKVVDITRKVGTVEKLTESIIYCSIDEKDYYLHYFMCEYPGRTLVFCNSIDCVRRLVTVLELLCMSPFPLHAKMHQRQRLKNLDRFKADSRGLLIATDVAARGLDIPDVQHVIHYQVPRTSENYIHRSGRTARADKEGLSVILLEPKEVIFYRRMCRTLNREKDLPTFPVDQSVMSTFKLRVDLAREIDKLEHTARKKSAVKNWFRKAAQELDIELDEDNNLMQDVRSEKEKSEFKKLLKVKRQQLKALLQKPVIPAGFSGKYPTRSGKLITPVSQAAGNKNSAIVCLQKEKGPRRKLLRGTGLKKKKIKKKYYEH